MSEQTALGRRGKKATMMQTARRLGVVLVVTAGSVAPVLAAGSAGAAPTVPKLGVVCTSGSVAGGTRTFDLLATTGYIDTPDGNSVFMWSYADNAAPSGGRFQSPGPTLCAMQGETIVVNLVNSLPEASSVVFPGQDSSVTATGGAAGLLTTEAAASNGTVSYRFTAGSPGTYAYESGSDVAKQVEMGLYGALVIRPNVATCPAVAGTNCAYDASTRYDPGREFLLLLSELDPDLHHAVETGAPFDINAKRSRYFAINGREFPDTIQDNGSALVPNQPYGALVRIQPNSPTNTQPALIRMLNVGLLNHPFHPHGNHTREIAQDGRLVAPTEHFGETIGSGQTQDFLLRWDDQDKWDPTTAGKQLPQPNYRDVFFKDGNTWYSGSPYLGYKGTLPVGVNSQNVCGEWYFPWHSHALNEFTNYDQGFGGMGTLLRVDPPGGCFASPTAGTIVGGALKSGSVTGLALDDNAYYQVNPRSTTRTSASTAAQTSMSVASAAGFPTSGAFYARIDNEVVQVIAGQGTTTWTVARGQLGSSAATHAAGATVTALATDWYGGFAAVPAGATNLKIAYKGANCASTTATTCAALPSNLPAQTVKICNWQIAGAAGCATATSAGWVTLPAPPTQPQAVGSTDVSSTWTLPAPADPYIGTGTYRGQVRVLVHTQRWTAPSPTPFSTWGNVLKIVYDAP